MKKYLYFLFAFIFLAGCSKNDGPVPNDIALERVPEPQVVKKGGSEVISLNDLAAFKGEFEVGVYYQSGIQPSKLDAVIRKNGDTSNVRPFRKDITTFPTELSITADDLEALFGAALAPGDYYDIGADVYTVSGKKYDAFPSKAAGYGSGISQQPGASTSIRYSVPCPYHDDVYQGDFKVLKDEWADYSPGAIVPVTRIDATHFSFKYGAPQGLPIVIEVNPITNEISVAKQVYGPIGYPPGWNYGPIYAESVPDQRNLVSPCDQTFGIVLKHTVAAGTFSSGAYIQMQKVN
jgi:hypothetical protein